MKRLVVLFLAAVLSLWPLISGAREVVNISSGWTFFTSADASTDLAATVNLPHVVLTAGTSNYLKDIDLPAAWADKRIFLRVGGASRTANVFVGGAHVAAHQGEAPFTVEITDRVRAGSAASLRIVTDSWPDLEVMPTAGREKIYGGLFRGVELIVCEQLAISPTATLSGDSRGGADGIWVTTERISRDRAEGLVRMELLAPSAIPNGSKARMKIVDGEGNQVSASELAVSSNRLEFPFSVENPRLWQGTTDPHLYNIEVALADSTGRTIDSLTVGTGFREIGIGKDNQLTINGIATRIRGVILSRDRQTVGTALTPFQIEEDIDLILEMGANAVRVLGGPHSDYFYALCDQAGLMVFNDGPFIGAAYPTDIDFVDTEEFKASGRRQFAEMIDAAYNHPSVVAWGVFANVSSRSGNPVPYIRELNELVKSIDPQRLTIGSSISDGDINFVTDLISFDLALGWESGLPDGVVPWLEQLRRGWPNLRAGISFAAGGSIFNQSEKLERPSLSSNYHPEGWQTFFHETYMRNAVDAAGLWGVFVGNMFDSGAAKAPAGALPTAHSLLEGPIDDRGLVTFDRKDRKDAFWLFKANWNRQTPFVRIAGGRLDSRSQRLQTIHVYSNQSEVELFTGGRSLGKRSAANGIFEWRDVVLRPGLNRLEARSGESTHRISVTLQ